MSKYSCVLTDTYVYITLS